MQLCVVYMHVATRDFGLTCAFYGFQHSNSDASVSPHESLTQSDTRCGCDVKFYTWYRSLQIPAARHVSSTVPCQWLMTDGITSNTILVLSDLALLLSVISHRPGYPPSEHSPPFSSPRKPVRDYFDLHRKRKQWQTHKGRNSCHGFPHNTAAKSRQQL